MDIINDTKDMLFRYIANNRVIFPPKDNETLEECETRHLMQNLADEVFCTREKIQQELKRRENNG